MQIQNLGSTLIGEAEAASGSRTCQPHGGSSLQGLVIKCVSSSLQWAPFCSLGLEPVPAHCQPQQRPGQMYKVSEVIGSAGEGVFSTPLWPLAAWLYACKLLY